MSSPQDTRLKDLIPAHDAWYNSALPMEMQRRGCTLNTRLEVLATVTGWTRQDDTAKIYWMSGMAGVGKTTIAYSVCEKLEQDKQLGASFFCSRASPECRDVNRIVPTIAYQLGRFSNPYQTALCEALSNTPDIARRNINVQFEKLIVEPLQKVQGAMPSDVVVVIDALDECSDVNGTKQVLDLLFRHTKILPLKFFVTSRPEPTISNRILPHGNDSRSILHLHDIERSLVQADIRTYLTEALASIQPAPTHVERLATRAGCLFIFAATVVRYILPDDECVDHEERLATMLDASSSTSGRDYEEIDKLYSMILSKALDQGKLKESEARMRQLVLWTVVCAREPMTIGGLAELLGVEGEQKVELAIQPLRSVLHVSERTGVVSTLHASFTDFMFSKERSNEFYCDKEQHDGWLAVRCFDVMSQSLRFNICDLETSFRFDADVPDLQGRVEHTISSALFYASRYWGVHLRSTGISTRLLSCLDQFIQHQLLFWMEVLNLKGRVEHGPAILLQATDWLAVSWLFVIVQEYTLISYSCRTGRASSAGSYMKHATLSPYSPPTQFP
jgi:nucleoside-triphosphatase THEP1